MNHLSFQEGEVIFHQGDEATTMYEIETGKVGIFANYGMPDQRQIAVLEALQTFGEMGIIENMPRSATAVALDDNTRIREVTLEEFKNYLKEKPVQVFLIMKQLSQRLRDTTQSYVDARHTIAEAAETEKKGEKQGSWLREKLEHFADVYRGILQRK